MERGHLGEVTWRAKSEVAEAMKVVKSVLMALSEPVLVLDKSLRAVIVNPALCDVMKIAPCASSSCPDWDVSACHSPCTRDTKCRTYFCGGWLPRCVPPYG